MNSRQFIFLSALTVPAYKIAMLPSYLAGLVGRDMWVSVLVATLIDVLVLGLILLIKTRECGSDNSNKCIRVLKSAFCVVYACYFALQCVVLSEESIGYLIQSFFDETERLHIAIPLIACAIYLAYKGCRSIGRCSDIFIWVLLVAGIVGVIFNNAQINFDNVRPVLDTEVGGVLVGAKQNVLWFGDYLPLLFIDLKDRKKFSSWKILLGGVAISFVTSFICLAFVAQWGDFVQNVPNAFARLSGYNFISADVGKVDWITIITWILSCVMKLSLLLLGVKQAFKRGFSNNVSKYAIFIVAGVVLWAVIYYITDVAKAYSLGVSVSVVGIVLTIVVPLLTAVMSVTILRKKKKGVKNG